MIYTLSKKTQRDGGESYESALKTIVEKVLDESGLEGITVNNRIVNAMKTQIYNLQAKARAARLKGGGRLVKKILDSWKSKTYQFKIFYNELDVGKLKEENSELRRKKRKLEETLVQEKVKKLHVEDKLTDALKKIRKTKKLL